MSDTSSLSTLRLEVLFDTDEALISQLYTLESACHAFPWSRGAFIACFNDPQYHIVAAYGEEQQVLGFYITQCVPRIQEATLMDICVSPHVQGQGIGRYLMQTMLAQLSDQGIQVVFLEVRASNQAAIHLYTQLGFYETGRRKGYYRAAVGREEAVLMQYTFT